MILTREYQVKDNYSKVLLSMHAEGIRNIEKANIKNDKYISILRRLGGQSANLP